MTTAEVLRGAAELIRPDGAWTQGCLAADASGRRVSPRDPDAVCWCLSGAIQASDPQFAERPYFRLVRKIIGGEALPSWNDHSYRTQSEVVSALLRAADLADKGEI